ncbi:MAG: hypothetical protein FWD40_09805 [Treponema sp.]|nr:hypothetical protein [Treponema sp.]
MFLRILVLIFLIIFSICSCASKKNNQEEDFVNESATETPEIQNGNVRLVLYEKTGNFSLYFLSNHETFRYEPLFNSREPKASYAAIFLNGNYYRLGDRPFRPKFERHEGNPGFIFESQDMSIRQVFSPVKTSSSNVVNGVKITFIIQNSGTRASLVGLKFLIDTILGEGRGRAPFLTNSQVITSELLIEAGSDDRFWISRGPSGALMGSIISPENPDEKTPYSVHFANWKRLNDAPWKIRYSQGRPLNNDSAVCYFFEPVMLEGGGTISYSVFLTTEDISFYNYNTERPPETAEPAAVTQNISENRSSIIDVEMESQILLQAIRNSINIDTYTLVRLQELLNMFIAGQVVLTEQDLMEIESAIYRHR